MPLPKQKQTTLIFLLLLALGLIVGTYHIDPAKHMITLSSGTALVPPRALPTFELRDQEDTPFTRERFKDRWSLLFFGYTHCPTICPSTLQLMKEVKQTIKELQLVMISADPEHDDPTRLKSYLEPLDPHFIGVTGAFTEIKSLAQGLGIFVDNQTESTAHIPHSGALLFINPEAELTAIFSRPTHANLLATDIRRLIAH